MRTGLGILLVLVGAGVMIFGLGSALRELIGLYQGAFTDPLGQPESAEMDTSRRMIRAAIIGAVGIPPFIIGGVLLKITMLQRLYRARRH